MNSKNYSPENLVAIPPQSLVQFSYLQDTDNYRFAADGAIPEMKLVGFPEDTDYSRSAMLYDGATYRIYFFRQGSNDTLYQGAFDEDTNVYQYGYASEPVLRITGAPDGVDYSSFAMLYDGEEYRLYLRPVGAVVKIFQFVYDEDVKAYEHYAAGQGDWPVQEMPEDADWSGWGMLFDGKTYRLYTWKGGTNHTQIYQAAFDEEDEVYEFGYDSIPVLNIQGTPPASYQGGFSMLHDETNYRFYLQTV